MRNDSIHLSFGFPLIWCPVSQHLVYACTKIRHLCEARGYRSDIV